MNHEPMGSNDEQIKNDFLSDSIACKTVNRDFLKDSVNSESLFLLSETTEDKKRALRDKLYLLKVNVENMEKTINLYMALNISMVTVQLILYINHSSLHVDKTEFIASKIMKI